MPEHVQKVVAGVDLGGTNTVFGIVNETGTLLMEDRLGTSSFETPDDLVEVLAERLTGMTKSFSSYAQLMGAGIGAPNGNFYRGTIEHAPNLPWKGVIPLANMLKAKLHQPVVLTNDANAAALGEMLFGAAKDLKDFIVITLGTGVGSGLVANGELIYGHDGFAGEIGHTIVDPEGRQCGCGRRGCLETYASAVGLKRTVFELMASTTSPSPLRSIPFDSMTTEQISAAAEGKDPIALSAFDRTGRILGLKLADAVAHTSPEAIILFGGLAKAGELIFEPTKKYFEIYLLNIFKGKTRLLPSGLPQGNVAILGAAALFWKELRK